MDKISKVNIKNWAFAIITIFLVCLLFISGTHVVTYLLDNKENEQIQRKIMENNVDKDTDSDKYSVDFAALKKENSDVVAYLKVNDTNIEYAVVRGSDNDFYLKHNFNKKRNYAGWIFSDYRNKFDGVDKNIVIFGHNMSDGGMFGTLARTLEKEWQDKSENRKIILITEDRNHIYEVFSTYLIRTESYYINTDFNDNAEFYEFLMTIKNRSNYNYNVALTPNDEILTLSSCDSSGNKRVVLHAKKIGEK